MQPQARHTRLREAVAAERLAMVQLLQELVRTPSVGGTRAESELQERLAHDFAASGLETDLWPLPLAELERAPDFPASKSPARTRLASSAVSKAGVADLR